MADSEGFFSYVRADDEHDSGNLTQLRKRLAEEVRMQTGKTFVIFQDREDILWGERWKARIERSIDGTTVLIAVITPAFLLSEACRAEVERFLERERLLKRDDLVLPLYYVAAEGLGDPSDAMAVQLNARQYVDWRELRFESFDHPDVRRALARMAKQIVKAIERTADAGSSMVAVPPHESGVDMTPGFVELVAEAEEAMPLFVATLTDFTAELSKLTAITQARTDAIKTALKGPTPSLARLGLIRGLARELEPVATRLGRLADEYLEQMARVDGGMSAIIDGIKETTEPSLVESAVELNANVKQLASSSAESFDSLTSFSNTARMAARQSATVRPVFTRIAQAVGKVLSSRPVFLKWAKDLNDALSKSQPFPGGPDEAR